MPKNHALKHLVFWILGFAGLWLGFYLVRPLFYTPWCAVQPTPCRPELVNALDQISFRHHSVFCDFLSNILQNTVAVGMLIVPWLALRSSKNKATFATVIMLLGTAANGALLELSHTLSQRPRPLVYNNPMVEGANIHQYNSFFSGHTSFMAMATLCTFLWIRRLKPAQKTLQGISFAAFLILTGTTGVLRILGGRHYPTDVICGAVAGTVLSLVLFHFLKPDLDAVLAIESLLCDSAS
jgi:membrane-associated phospholipid phosphatase